MESFINEENQDISMNIQIIGKDMNDIIKEIKQYWECQYIPNVSIENQIIKYFERLKTNKKEFNEGNRESIKECLIVHVSSLKSKEVNQILEKMNNLFETYFMPLVLFLTDEFQPIKIKYPLNLKIEKKKYKKVDERTIYYTSFFEKKDDINNFILPLLYRFCSIHNELGERFKDILLSEDFSYNLNIVCFGRNR